MYKRILESWAEKSPWTVLAFVLLWVLVQYVLIPSQQNAREITAGVLSSMTLQVTALTELTSVVEKFTLKVPSEHKELQRAMADIGDEQKLILQEFNRTHQKYWSMQ